MISPHHVQGPIIPQSAVSIVKYHCVRRIANSEQLYLGRSVYDAARVLDPGTCFASDPDALVASDRCAREAVRFRLAGYLSSV